MAIRKRIGAELRQIWNAPNLEAAEESLRQLVASYRDGASNLAQWLEDNIPEGLAVFILPEHHRRRLRTSNPIERAIQQEIKRRTIKVRVFPNQAITRTPGERGPGRNRRQMGHRRQGLHQLEMPG